MATKKSKNTAVKKGKRASSNVAKESQAAKTSKRAPKKGTKKGRPIKGQEEELAVVAPEEELIQPDPKKAKAEKKPDVAEEKTPIDTEEVDAKTTPEEELEEAVVEEENDGGTYVPKLQPSGAEGKVVAGFDTGVGIAGEGSKKLGNLIQSPSVSLPSLLTVSVSDALPVPEVGTPIVMSAPANGGGDYSNGGQPNESMVGNYSYFTISVSGNPAVPVTVQYSTADGDGPKGAQAGLDYVSTSGSVTFNPGGPLTQVVAVPILTDDITEGVEKFKMNLSDPVNAMIAAGQGIGTIFDDVTLDISGQDFVQEGNTATYTLSIDGALDVDLDVDVQIQLAGDADSAEPEDFDPSAPVAPSIKTVTIPAGSTSVMFDVDIVNDTTFEGSEDYTVNIVGVNGGYGNVITGTDYVETTITEPFGTLPHNNFYR